MPDGVDLNPDPLAEPLDMGELIPPARQPLQAPPSGNRRADFIRLAALIPLALKAGPGGIEGLLQGFQQAQAKKEQLAQQQAQHGRLAANDQALADYRTKTLQGQEQGRRQQFLSQFTQGLSGLEDQAAIDAYLKLQQGQASALGLNPTALQSYVQTTQTPSTVQKRGAEKAIGRLKNQFGEKWMEQGARFQHMVGGEQVSFDELLRRAGMAADPNAPPVSDAPDLTKSSLDVQAAAALSKGDTETYSRLLKVKKEMGQADDRPITANTGAADQRTNARIDRIVNSFNSHPIVKEYNEVQSQQGIIKSIVNSPWSGPGDMAAVFAFMKALDPNSVVRETEYANAAKSGNIFQGWAARFNGALNPDGGFLSDRVRRDFLRTIDERMTVKGAQYQNLRRQIVERVDRIKAGAPETGDEAIINYETGATAPTSDAGGAWTTLADGTKVRVKR